MKILSLGNEFVKSDSLAKKICIELEKESGIKIFNIKDSFQLMDELKSDGDFILIDVVFGLKDVKLIGVGELKLDSIVTSHDFDAGFVINLLSENKNIKIIGIPGFGNYPVIKKKVKDLLNNLLQE
jgi:hypothetical protein